MEEERWTRLSGLVNLSRLLGVVGGRLDCERRSQKI